MNPNVKARIWDVTAASPLILWYVMGGTGLLPQIVSGISQHPPSAEHLLRAAAQIAALGFMALQIVFFLTRRMPIARANSLAPRVVALIAANIEFAFLALPSAPHGVAVTSLALALTTIGTAGAIVAIFWLGRGFSILPQARQLVVTGPYRLVRHPLYLMEQIATLGLIPQFSQPWSSIIGIASMAIQFPRMHYEESVLSAAFPAYRIYMKRTRRLIPGLY